MQVKLQQLSVFFIIDLIYIELIKAIGEKAIKVKQETQNAIDSLLPDNK